MSLITHNGKFHADEVFAVSLLKMLARFQNLPLVRTRDPQTIAQGMAVVDVGGVYDYEKLRFDHHQPEFKDTFSPKYETLLSSAGLVYKHFGKEIISLRKPDLTEEALAAIYDHVYAHFVEAFDAHDNGISAYPSDLKPRFHSPMDIFWQINLFNTAWNAKDTGNSAQMSGFTKALALMSEVFDLYLTHVLDAWLPARQIVHDALLEVEQRQLAAKKTKLADECDLNAQSSILVLPCSCPWKDHLFESSLPSIAAQILYLVYPESTSGSWRLQACPVSASSFESRKALPAAWRGARDSELEDLLKESGVAEAEGAIFVHRSGFIGGHKSKQGAIAMAEAAINMN